MRTRPSSLARVARSKRHKTKKDRVCICHQCHLVRHVFCTIITPLAPTRP